MLFYIHQRNRRILLLEGQKGGQVSSTTNVIRAFSLLTDLCRWDTEQHTGVEVDWRDTVEQVDFL